jgi:hypothetical protein
VALHEAGKELFADDGKGEVQTEKGSQLNLK